jgi:ABC-type antimicrobial peptide transport system permease subunit
MAYSVAQRVREIGIRMALGAQRRQVIRLVLGQSLLVTAVGIETGIGGAIVITRISGTCCSASPRSIQRHSSRVHDVRGGLRRSLRSSRHSAPPESTRWWRCGTNDRAVLIAEPRIRQKVVVPENEWHSPLWGADKSF